MDIQPPPKRFAIITPARVCASGVKRLLLSVCQSVCPSNIEVPFKVVT